ncbi:hypothetical protein I79_003958 [Cricetulus griseus]|uniref:Secreted protein n=1 Tax=Cricetulus griseus TaxID=10029 RepID=G3H1D4_CRIGR|nr:hypothetical protein I79_003958 [Cricetulus griseus]
MAFFFFFFFWFFKTGFLCVALDPVCPGTHSVDTTRLASNSQRSTCLCLPNAGIAPPPPSLTPSSDIQHVKKTILSFLPALVSCTKRSPEKAGLWHMWHARHASGTQPWPGAAELLQVSSPCSEKRPRQGCSGPGWTAPGLWRVPFCS